MLTVDNITRKHVNALRAEALQAEECDYDLLDVCDLAADSWLIGKSKERTSALQKCCDLLNARQQVK